MSAANQDRTTGDGEGGITRRLGTLNLKDYCDRAVVHLKAGRIGEAYVYANEALEMEGKDAKAAALRRYALYALHPPRRLFDKALALHEEADRSLTSKDYGKAHELLSMAKKWRCTPGILWTGSYVDLACERKDLGYVDLTEALETCGEDKLEFATRQILCLSYLGYKTVPVLEPQQQRTDKPPARYRATNWPKELRILRLDVYMFGYASATKIDGSTLMPRIPLDQLGRFLNDHVQGQVRHVLLDSTERLGDEVLRLLDEVTAPGRLHADVLTFSDFFRLPWAGVERILDGRTLRAKAVSFAGLQLPCGVDANKLLKLPTIRECALLDLYPRTDQMPPIPGPSPLFSNAALMEWIETSDGRHVRMTMNYLASGLLSFLAALKTDFLEATQPHSYRVEIHCPHINVIAELGVQEEGLSNRLGETMAISVGEDPVAIVVMEQRFETVRVDRSWSGANKVKR